MIPRLASLLALGAGTLLLQSGGIGAAPDPGASTPAAIAGPMEITTAGFEEAATALRAHDCAGAQGRLTAVASAAANATPANDATAAAAGPAGATENPAVPMARLLRGAYAAACGDSAAAETFLAQAAAPGGALEDWRLFLLADSADRLGHAPAAQAAARGGATARITADGRTIPLCLRTTR